MAFRLNQVSLNNTFKSIVSKYPEAKQMTYQQAFDYAHEKSYGKIRNETDDFFAKKFQEMEKSSEQFILNHPVILERIHERKTQQKRKNLVVKKITSKISELFKMIK